MNYKRLKYDLRAALAKHGLVLFEDDGQWCARSDKYDMLQFAASSKGAKEEWAAKTLGQALS